MKSNINLIRFACPLLAFSVMALPTAAAPITFGFQATVGPVPAGNDDIGLPFTLEEGSVLDGTLTIDPDLDEPFGANARRSVQPYKITLSFAGFSFGAERFETLVIDNSSISDFPFPGPVDSIGLDCSSSSVDCNWEPIAFPSSPPLETFIRVRLIGERSLLDEPKTPTDVEIWNAFTLIRYLDFGFQIATNPPESGDAAGFFTTVGDFYVIPEPLPNALLAMGLVWLQIGCRYARGLHSQRFEFRKILETKV